MRHLARRPPAPRRCAGHTGSATSAMMRSAPPVIGTLVGRLGIGFQVEGEARREDNGSPNKALELTSRGGSLDSVIPHLRRPSPKLTADVGRPRL